MLSPERAQIVGAVSVAITLPFLNQSRLARSLARLRRWQSRASGHKPPLPAKTLVIIVLSVLIAGKLLLLPTLNNFASFAVAGILLLGVISTVRHVLREAIIRSQSLIKTPWLHVRLWEQQLVTLFCIPMAAARIVSLCGALSVGAALHPFLNVTYLIISVILLLALKPERSSFIGWCPQCKSPTPIAFVEYGSCPQCDEQLARNA
jgi:hypothetical protein